MLPYDDECAFEDPTTFSQERVAALVQSYLSDLKDAKKDALLEDARAWVLDPDNWQLRTIIPVPNGYNEELYKRLARL